MVVFLPLAFFSQEPAQKGRIQVNVVGNGAPVRGADVFVKSGSGEFEETVRTNANGMAQLSNVPHGPLRVVVAARGWKTSGRQQDLRGAQLEIRFNLERDGMTPSPSPSPSASPSRQP